MYRNIAFAVALAAILSAQSAQDRRIQPIVPRKQVALVIGNAAYPSRPLANPVHDAEAMAARLRQLNFDVALVTDAGRKTMGQAIDRFLDKLGTGDVAFFYYSGHGMQVDGENYLIPTDFQGQNETDVRYDTHPLGRIQDRMERSGAQLNILVLDACRDNPFRSAARSDSHGLAAPGAGRGTFIALATSPGHTASDNPGGRYGLFTQYLLEALSARGLALDDVFNLVRERVDEASGGKQVPWTLSSVVGRYSFVPGEPAPATVPPPASIDRGPRVGDSKVNSIDGQKYLWIPPGTSAMGCSAGDSECDDDEKPAHQVTIAKGFWLGQTPVTQEAYQRVTGKNPSNFKGAKLPVETVSWDESKAYCAAIGGRLPTEAEWEYAARAGSAGPRYGNLDDIAWYGGNSGNQTHEVGQKQANAFGLFDMLGNVWQWVADWYGNYQSGAQTDPAGASSGTYRTLRGGSWLSNPRIARVSYRLRNVPGNRGSGTGFRCVGD